MRLNLALHEQFGSDTQSWLGGPVHNLGPSQVVKTLFHSPGFQGKRQRIPEVRVCVREDPKLISPNRSTHKTKRSRGKKYKHLWKK